MPKKKPKEPPKYYVAHHPKVGVFFGHWDSKGGKWSKKSPTMAKSMKHVPVWRSMDEFVAYVRKHLSHLPCPPKEIKLLEVTPDFLLDHGKVKEKRATEKACVEAGVEPWLG